MKKTAAQIATEEHIADFQKCTDLISRMGTGKYKLGSPAMKKLEAEIAKCIAANKKKWG